jgi:transposase-like protein
MDATNQRIISHTYVQKESFNDSYKWFISLKYKGLYPLFITTDGERSVTRAMRLIWPNMKLQRCLYHIQHEGMRWLRTYPKTAAGKELRTILSKLSKIKTLRERDQFINMYLTWVNKYETFVLALPRTEIAYKDLRRTMVLINNAMPELFHYLTNKNVHSTTNALEGFHSRLKSDYQRHRGLTKKHRIKFIHWYCYYHNG